MLDVMTRSAIKFLKRQGDSNLEIATKVGHHRNTVAKVLAQPTDVQPKPRNKLSAAAVFDQQIEKWFDQNIPVKRMLELAQTDAKHPYTGGHTAFYDYVRKRRVARSLKPSQIAVRFEGLPGEYLQIDWGELRNFPFTRQGLSPKTKYFFAARLKYSRYMFVSFQDEMGEETLLRCLVDCFVELVGVPWAVVTDNMKTVTLGRDDHFKPIWNPAFLALAFEFNFHPEVCAPASGNQKGTVENLVKFVKGNFVAGRSFYDEEDLAAQLATWLHQVNHQRPCEATREVPVELLRIEQPKFGPLPPSATDYGIYDTVVVNREGLVTIQTNRYSVPAELVGQTLTARLFKERVELFVAQKLVASHPRDYGRNGRHIIPQHFEAAFKTKPRARVMVYRDWLVKLSPVVADYISEICHKQRETMNEQMVALYELAQSLGQAELVAALQLAAQQHLYGAEYVRAIGVKSQSDLTSHCGSQTPLPGGLSAQPVQAEVERQLADYERFVANAELVGLGIGELPNEESQLAASGSQNGHHRGGLQ
jgi:transposase